jgi:hypothetical protein
VSNYCELSLYTARCLSNGLAPGRFYPEKNDIFSLNRIAAARRTIDRYLLPFQNWGLIIDYHGLVKDNAEADILADYAKRHFDNAREIIEPHMCIHGRIIFARKIRFDGCSEGDADTIVKIMKVSGHIPNELNQKADWIRKTGDSEKTIISRITALENTIDDFWKSALKFY